MKCLSCDTILSDFEACRKYSTGQYIDLCNRCFYSGVSEDLNPCIERDDLRKSSEEPIEYEGIITPLLSDKEPETSEE